jgi:hypothetical protein
MKLFGAPIGKCLFAFLLLAIIFQLAISACRAGRQGFDEGAEPSFAQDDGFEEGFQDGFGAGTPVELDPDEEDAFEGFYEGAGTDEESDDEDEDDDGFETEEEETDEESDDEDGVEGFTGSDLNYQMGRGVVLGGGGKAWDQRKMAGSRGPQTQKGYKLPPTRMAILDGVRFAPECCPSAYSNSTGCVCAPKNLERYVAETRAGNNTKNCTSF